MNARPRKPIDTSTYEGRFAARLKMLREKAGLSVLELADKTGMPARTLQNWESMTSSPVDESLPTIAEALGVKLRTLMPEK